jgi:hypothetical protein
MTECPVCHQNYKRLDLHLKMKHREQATRRPVYKQTSSPKVEMRRIIRREVAIASKPKEPELPPGPLIQPLILADIEEDCPAGRTPATLQAVILDTSWERQINSMPFGGKKPLGSMKWMIIAIVAIVAIIGVLYFTGIIPGAK